MGKRRQRPKKKKENLLSTYTDPRAPGALGGLRRFARAQRLSQAQAQARCHTREEWDDVHETLVVCLQESYTESCVEDDPRRQYIEGSTMGERE